MTARLASVAELESVPYREFMARMNAFATAGDLRTFKLGDMAEFRRWHLCSAPYHNYVVGAAVLTRRADALGVMPR